jgi:hypothetical protein
MADPLLDEANIIRMLSEPADLEHAEDIQAGAVQAVMDLYDRKVTREEFVGNLAIALQLYGMCSKLWILNNIRTVFARGDLDADKFDRANHDLCATIGAQANVVAAVVKRLQECPTSMDQVH